MNRLLQIFNFAGVLILAILCVMQWRQNSRLNREVSDLETTRMHQVDEIAAQKKAIAEYAADLEDFRQRLKLAESQSREFQQNLKKTTVERNQLVVALEKWTAAVTERDNALKKAGTIIQSLVNERDSAVVKFNELAGKYNSLVHDQSAKP